jgi:hypothetical protein
MKEREAFADLTLALCVRREGSILAAATPRMRHGC